MKRLLLLLFGTLVLTGPTLASATICTFDVFSGSGIVPDGYCGANWNGEWSYYDLSQPPYTPHSAPERVYPTGNACCGFINLNDVVFEGAWFSGYSGLSGTINYYMFYQGANVAANSLNSVYLSDVPFFFSSDYSGPIDLLYITSDANFWIMDDLTYTAAPVPEPGSLALMSSGVLAGVAALRRRRAVVSERRLNQD